MMPRPQASLSNRIHAVSKTIRRPVGGFAGLHRRPEAGQHHATAAASNNQPGGQVLAGDPQTGVADMGQSAPAGCNSRRILRAAKPAEIVDM